jgi:hypothetical protein
MTALDLSCLDKIFMEIAENNVYKQRNFKLFSNFGVPAGVKLKVLGSTQ